MDREERNTLAAVHEREAAFHDAQAAEDGPAENLPPRVLNFWERAVLDGAQPLRGKSVLDLGCGRGDITMHLVDAGAEVTAVDISPGMVRLASERLGRFRPASAVRFAVVPAEATGLESSSFDLVVGNFVLHHLDLTKAATEVHRLLRPGGRAVFVETSAYNPVLRLLRRWVVHSGLFGIRRIGTRDEHPLTRRDVRRFASRFTHHEVDHPNFQLFYIFNRNLFDFGHRRINELCNRIDAAIARLRFTGPLSYYLRLTLTK
jgi:ubiquinone/menaquinone biosynthesis C-methylase UbiE